MNEEHHAFWHKLFFGSSAYSEREQKVLAYLIHRMSSGAHLGDVILEEYVRRNVSQTELEDIVQDPALVGACHEYMREDFSSEELAPSPSPSSAL